MELTEALGGVSYTYLAAPTGEKLIIEEREYLATNEDGNARWPTFQDGLAVSQIVDAARRSNTDKRWVTLDPTTV